MTATLPHGASLIHGPTERSTQQSRRVPDVAQVMQHLQ